MREQDYPLRHLERMTELARALAELPALLLDHDYSYETFGSWNLTVRHRGIPIQLVFDGKERTYGLYVSATKKRPYSWSEVMHRPAPDEEPSVDTLVGWIRDAVAPK